MNGTSFLIRKTNPLSSLLARLRPAARPKAGRAERATAVPEEPAAAPRGKKILVVDDDAVILKTTAWKLQRQGYAVVTAIDAAEALRSAREEKPDLILLDVNFPPDVGYGGSLSWDGFQIMSWLLRLEGSRKVPVLLFTGADLAKCKHRALAGNATALVHKSLPPDGLLTMIQRALDKQPSPPAGGVQLDFEI